jgi:hypothetical protein
MKTKIKFILTYLLITAYGGLATATIRYVNKTGSSTPPYTSWITSSDSIQKCIDYAIAGDTIYVANGIYKEQVIFKQGITLLGSGIDSCIIDTREITTADIHIRSIKMESDCVLKGFWVMSNTPDSGIAVFVQGLENIIVENNSISYSFVGIYPGDSKCLISGNHIINSDIGIFLEAISKEREQIITQNTMDVNHNGVLISFGTKPIIKNNVINVHNASNVGSGYTGGGSDTTKLFNNLIISDVERYGINCSIVPTLVYNNFLIGSFTYRGVDAENYNIIKNNVIINSQRGIVTDAGETPVIQYNNIWNVEQMYNGFTPDSTNITVDPMVVDEGNLDFHLQMFSPLIDKGDPNILDKDGSRSDIGLFGGPYGESYTYQDLAPKPPRNLSAALDSNIIILRWLKNTEADFHEYRIYRDTTSDFNLDTLKVIGISADTSFTDTIITTESKTYYYKITALDNQNSQSPSSEEVAVVITGINGEVKLTANDFKLYANYPNPFNPSTTISYRLKERGHVKLMVYNIKGELVTLLVNEEKEAGYYELEYRPNNIASGAYLVVIEIIGENKIPLFMDSRKMIFIK